MREIVPITGELAAVYRQVRLTALRDAPSAFGSTYAREVLFTEEEWLQRAGNLDKDRKIGFIAMDAGEPCGLIGCLADEQDSSRADVVSMWVAPSHRRTGLSSALLDAVRAWAVSRNIATLQLMVTSNNYAAIAFYERYGFVKTGRTEPYSNDPALLELEMVRHSTA